MYTILYIHFTIKAEARKTYQTQQPNGKERSVGIFKIVKKFPTNLIHQFFSFIFFFSYFSSFLLYIFIFPFLLFFFFIFLFQLFFFQFKYHIIYNAYWSLLLHITRSFAYSREQPASAVEHRRDP